MRLQNFFILDSCWLGRDSSTFLMDNAPTPYTALRAACCCCCRCCPKLDCVPKTKKIGKRRKKKMKGKELITTKLCLWTELLNESCFWKQWKENILLVYQNLNQVKKGPGFHFWKNVLHFMKTRYYSWWLLGMVLWKYRIFIKLILITMVIESLFYILCSLSLENYDSFSCQSFFN